MCFLIGVQLDWMSNEIRISRDISFPPKYALATTIMQIIVALSGKV